MEHEPDVVRQHWIWAAAQQRSQDEINAPWGAPTGDAVAALAAWVAPRLSPVEG